MAEMISRTFVIVVLLNYVVLLGILVHWTVRTWLPKPGKTVDPQRSHGVSPAPLI
jgi:hypothetical protein